jgi:hypothetical protein
MTARGETAAEPGARALAFPVGPRVRDRFVVERRPPWARPDPSSHQGTLVEDECQPGGRIARVATVFLTGRECRWHCVMCDLWRHTTLEDTPEGAIPAQLDQALLDLRGAPGPAPSQIKLYNASSFFDPLAVPDADFPAIAERLTGFERVIVESHPALVGEGVRRFRAAISGALEVAMGLETAHPAALRHLNKRMTLDQFARAADCLGECAVALRAFVLVSPPFVPRAEQDEWLLRSVDFAFDCGATAVSLIPTRPGNGALEALAAAGQFASPTLADLERSFDLALARSRGRVFADLWDLGRFAECRECLDERAQRLRLMNLEQRTKPRRDCPACAGRETA